MPNLRRSAGEALQVHRLPEPGDQRVDGFGSLISPGFHLHVEPTSTAEGGSMHSGRAGSRRREPASVTSKDRPSTLAQCSSTLIRGPWRWTRSLRD
jgi:hypothetical protein